MTDYYAIRDADGTIVGLSRIRSDDAGTHPELLRGGTWLAWPSIMDNLFDRDPRDDVDEAEAARIAADLGGSL